jgi:hypothetical protein
MAAREIRLITVNVSKTVKPNRRMSTYCTSMLDCLTLQKLKVNLLFYFLQINLQQVAGRAQRILENFKFSENFCSAAYSRA